MFERFKTWWNGEEIDDYLEYYEWVHDEDIIEMDNKDHFNFFVSIGGYCKDMVPYFLSLVAIWFIMMTLGTVCTLDGMVYSYLDIPSGNYSCLKCKSVIPLFENHTYIDEVYAECQEKTRTAFVKTPLHIYGLKDRFFDGLGMDNPFTQNVYIYQKPILLYDDAFKKGGSP